MIGQSRGEKGFSNCSRFLVFTICRKRICSGRMISSVGCTHAPIYAPLAVAFAFEPGSLRVRTEIAPRLRHFPDGYESFASVLWGK
jgi:hypothetical protein